MFAGMAVGSRRDVITLESEKLSNPVLFLLASKIRQLSWTLLKRPEPNKKCTMITLLLL